MKDIAPWRWALVVVLLIGAVAVGYIGGLRAEDRYEADTRYTGPVPWIYATPDPDGIVRPPGCPPIRVD